MNSQNNPLCERPTPWDAPEPLTVDELQLISFLRTLTPEEIYELADIVEDYCEMRHEGYSREDIMAYIRRTYDLE